MDPIAIIGMACRLPGGADDPDRFWRLLRSGTDAIREIPAERGDPRLFFGTDLDDSGDSSTIRWGGFVDGIDTFDPQFFGISLREAPCVDPQQRMLLEAAWEALEDGGQLLDERQAATTGVFIGISTNDYQQLQASMTDRSLLDVHTILGCSSSIAANRISYCLDAHGPSVALDTACSSSLVAVHLACRSLWSGESTLALAGGVNALLSPGGFVRSMLSPDGRCKAFDARANGFVRAEGVGMVLLKPLAAALADGNPIYALIRGTAVNADGRTPGITVPNPAAQAALIRDACRQAGVDPGEVHYVEAHGTGTAVGDPIEAHALGTTFGAARPASRPCVVGSVKTNIGHLEAGAGIAGLIKVALMLKHRRVPPNLHFVEPNPRIDFTALRLRVPVREEALPEGQILAGINSFGFGGVNAHAVVQSWHGDAAATQVAHDMPQVGAVRDTDKPATDRVFLLPLSARSDESLRALARRYATFLRTGDPSGLTSSDDVRLDPRRARRLLGDTCYTAALHRRHHEVRAAVVGRSCVEVAQQLDALADDTADHSALSYASQAPRRVVFMFGGQGSQWAGMATGLLRDEPVFRDAIAELDALVRRHAGWSLLDVLQADEADSQLAITAVAQPAIFCVQVALAALWRSWGIEPDAVVGHSVGEVAAAHVSGALDLDTAVRVIVHRGLSMNLASRNGRMLAAGVPPAEADDLVATIGGDLVVAAYNGPASVTLSGDPAALARVVATLQPRGVFLRPLAIEYAFHSAHMDPARTALLSALHDVVPRVSRIPMWSTVTGTCVGGETLDVQYWWRNIRQPVRFDAAVGGLIAGGHKVFLEVGPHPVLASAVAEALRHAGAAGVVAASMRRAADDRSTMLASAARLYVAGLAPHWRALLPAWGGCIRLPRYAWTRARYWQETADIAEARQRPPDHPLLGRSVKAAHPHWDHQLRPSLLSLLADHQVHGRIVFPAAGFIEMALAAGAQLFGDDGCLIEELEMQKPLLLSATGSLPRLQFTYDPHQQAFTISSLAGEAQRLWVLHCVGRLLPAQGRGAAPWPAPQTSGNDVRRLDGPALYGALHDLGFQYGPAFRRVGILTSTDASAVGEVSHPDDWHTEAFLVHPAVLDACFHVVFGLGRAVEDRAAFPRYLPARFRRIRWLRRPTRVSHSHARLVHRSPRFMEVDLRITTDAGETALEIDGFTMLAVDGARSAADDALARALYTLEWQRQPRPGSPVVVEPPDFLPDPRTLVPGLSREANRLAARGWLPRFRAVEGDIDQLCAQYLAQAFQRLGVWPVAGAILDVEALRARVAPQHHAVLERHLDLLASERLLEPDGPAWRVPPHVAPGDPPALWRALFHRFPAYLPELTGIEAFGRHLADILRGEAETLGVLFAETSFIEQFYSDSVTFRDYYALLQTVVDDVVQRLPDGRILRVLELGAGTGGLTASLTSHLPAAQTDYVFTDVSPLFLGKAEQRFRRHPWIRYASLDLDREPEDQGFAGQQFDIVLASEVLHATSDLAQTLRRIRRLLAPGGLLLALELDTPPRWVDLVFALTKGWWAFSDRALRSDSPLLPRERWVSLLESEGFEDVAAVADDDGVRRPIQSVLLGRAPATGARPMAAAIRTEGDVAADGSAPAAGHWLVFADRHGLGDSLAARLTAAGGTCMLVPPDDARSTQGEGIARALDGRPGAEALRGVVFLRGVEAADAPEPTLDDIARASQEGCAGLLALVQRLDAESFRGPLWVVTRGTQPAGKDGCRTVSHAPLWGLARVVMNEHPRLRCRLIDLDAKALAFETEALAAEMLAAQSEDEVALRGARRYVLRLVTGRIAAPVLVRTATETPYRLEVTRPGVLDDLRLQPLTRRPPGPGEVEIQADAASLNFRDVMKALGIYPRELEDSTMLGDECAGTVVAVGPGVTRFRVGDHVTAFASRCLASHVTAPIDDVLPTPAGLTPEDAVTMPVAFITAAFTLTQQARLQPGERVLIHAAAGGVGLAAVQVARLAGAEIFATAGSPRKRALLSALGVPHVMDSRSLAWADDVMRITEGHGVDVVLNSLAGEALAKGLSVLGTNGRFIEIGKRDVFQNTKLGLRLFRKSLSFHLFDLVTAVPTQGERIRAVWRQVHADLDAGRLAPLPTRVFPMNDVVEGFRHMMEARHVGKIVFRLDQQPVRIEPEVEAQRLPFRDDASYLVSGGFGGFSLAIARWMVQHGARHLVLVGRRGAATGEARQAVAWLRQHAEVLEAQVDITDEPAVAALLRRIAETMPPLRGVMHAAMVLDDGVIAQLNPARLTTVMAPKVLGAWNLHRLTAGRPLDFFVVHSSFTSMTGNPGQGNYSAANAFLDSLAHYRRGLGLPGLCVNWGSIKEVGYIARTADLGDTLSRLGVMGIPVDQALQLLGRLMRSTSAQMGVMALDWRQLAEYIATLKVTARFAVVLAGTGDETGAGGSRGHLRDTLMRLPGDERPEAVLAFLREHAAKVLRTTPGALDPNRPLAELGLDSLMAVELGNRLESDLGVALPLGTLTAGSNLTGLMDLLLDVLQTSHAAVASGA